MSAAVLAHLPIHPGSYLTFISCVFNCSCFVRHSCMLLSCPGS
ncbi:hypothetical protein L345_16050, partial [Ophiophagus hannah]